MKRIIFVFICFIVLSVFVFSTVAAPSETIKFSSKPIKSKEHSGLVFKVSEPYLWYQKWDTEHTGTARFAIALEVNNKSDKNISAVYFDVVIYDNKGKEIYKARAGAGPDSFEPNKGNVLEPGYKGVFGAFVLKEKPFFDEYKKIKVVISEVKIASASLNDKPVFSNDKLVFKDHPGIEIKLSKPYVYLDDLSGNERFAIAVQFKNATKKPVKYINIKAKIYDNQGLLVEREMQQHNGLFIPEPRNFNATRFPVNYEGVNKAFFTSEKSLLDTYSKIEIEITSVDY